METKHLWTQITPSAKKTYGGDVETPALGYDGRSGSTAVESVADTSHWS